MVEIELFRLVVDVDPIEQKWDLHLQKVPKFNKNKIANAPYKCPPQEYK